MLQSRVLFGIGIWTAVLPFLGFPKNIKNILFVLTGLLVIYVALVVYKKQKLSKDPVTKMQADTFTENRDFVEK